MLHCLLRYASLLILAVNIHAAVPPLQVTREAGEIRIRQIECARVVGPNAPALDGGRDGRAVGRNSVYLDVADLAATPPLGEFKRDTELSVCRGDFFDLWSAYQTRLVADEETAIRLHLDLISAGCDSVYLLLGGKDSCLVYANGSPLWGVNGGREHLDGDTAVRIPLDADGRAQVDIIAWRKEPWRQVPDDHVLNEWVLNLTVCAEEQQAWRSVVRRMSHFFDTPIVSSIADLRTTFHLDHHAAIDFYDLDGVLVGRARTTPTGRVEIVDSVLKSMDSFVGVALLEGELAEAVVLTGGQPLDALWEPCLQNSGRTAPGWNAWAYRCRHLFKEQFRDDRDHRWARKTAATMALAGLKTDFDRERSPFRQWASARLEWGEYVSRIDGTKQYYRAAVQPSKNNGTRPLLVVLPGVPFPVRPFLESYMAADMQGAEELTALAFEAGCDVLWPGVVDIDYGGNLTRTWIKETIEAFETTHPSTRRQIFVVGTCAAGVAASGFAATYGGVNGLVLWTPVAERPCYRWPFRDPAGWPLLPRDVMRAEAVATELQALRNVPVFVLFDHDEPGHGDPVGTAAMCRALVSIGGHVEEEWVAQPEHHMVWGMRAAVGQRRWLGWVMQQASNSTRSPARQQPGPSGGQTIKNALIRGYKIGAGEEPLAKAWLQRWGGLVRQYRGEPDHRGSSADDATPVEVKVRSLQEFREQIEAGFGHRRQVLTQPASSAQIASDYDILFGARVESGASDRVEIWVDERSTGDSLPPIDLMREGCCEAALWGWRNGHWETIQIWL